MSNPEWNSCHIEIRIVASVTDMKGGELSVWQE
jgi:hypothetical protein